MNKISHFLSLFIISFIIYLIVVRTLEPAELLLGLLIALIAALAGMRFFPVPLKALNPVRWFWFLLYVPFFIKEMVVANLKIAGIVLSPRLPIAPELKTAKTTLKTPAGIVMLTSSITLTPGTLSVEAHGDEISIHCVNNPASAREIMKPFEKYIERITE